MSSKITKRDDYNSEHKCTWCPGCGNFAIWYMLKQALFELGIEPHNIVIVYDIGCNGNGANFLKVYGFHGLHGRALPVAQAIKLVNSGIKVIAVAGDGGGMGLGIGHFIHACRRNVDITYILHDNQVYGLTTGQASPRTDRGAVTKTTPEGNAEDPVNPVALAITSNASFVARGFSGSPHHLKEMIKEAIKHKGFALVDVLQPCVTFNKLNTYAWYTKRAYDLQESGHDMKSKTNALLRSYEWGSKIPLGVFYKSNDQEYSERVHYNKPYLQEIPNINVSKTLKKYKV